MTLPRRNVLVFHLGALGDFILTWPVALALGRLYPQSRIFYVTHGEKGRLAERALRIDSVDVESGWHALFAAGGELPERPAKLLAGAHTVVSFVSDGADAWADNVRRLAPVASLVTLRPTTLSTPPVGEHASTFIERQLQPWPAIATAVGQILKSVAARGIAARGRGDGSVVLHPGSGADFKCWPVARFMELAAKLTAAGRPVKVLYGEVEEERWPAGTLDALRAAVPSDAVERPRDLVRLWEILNAASAFVGNDSGPAHLAGIIGVPTVALFGPTDPAVWKPLGPMVKAVECASLADLGVDQVWNALQG